eukprot:CAMPEP_0201596108 /NCGR_PEP_ID=MMETSP0190_2-20130828/192894_1 /ASSEMBLY_ACC=CAM_ASM_000263 /TAXON_ID=37353 /ORGANISM="Rosalina sp." /LENGTH=274 /DNA_ID=CAMNT_0048056333 /DNA_START=2858 /DNA_END=3682 /DNA_ORIENTATION=+
MIDSDEGKIESVPDLLNFHQEHEDEHKKKKDKDIMIDSDEGKIESVPDLLNFHQEHEDEHKKYDDDKPSNWVKFTENEGEIVHIEDGDHMMPSLLDLNEMQNFAFSDLASLNAQNGVDLIDIMDKDIMNNNNYNNSNRIDKAAILSMYNIDNNGNNNHNNNNMVNYNAMNPQIGMNPSSPFPKREIMANNNYIYSNYFVYNHDLSSNVAQSPLNENINKKDKDKRENSVNENPFRNDSNYNNNKMIKAKFNPFNYINDLCANNGHYVYNANVSC